MLKSCAPVTFAIALAGLSSACTDGVPSDPTNDTARLEAALVDFEALEPAEARAAYQAMTLDEQATLWRASYGRHLASGALTPAQAAVLAEMAEHAEACLASRATTLAYYARLEAVMSDEEIARFAAGLGRHGEGFLVEPASSHDTARQVPGCTQNLTCSTCRCDSWPGNQCQVYICPACTVVEDSCGPFGWFDCDGMPGSPGMGEC